MILNSILEAIGNTPLVRLNRVSQGIAGDVLAKVEYFNPGNSTKDRVAMKMIVDAERDGRLKPGGTIIEGTSGNTGMGIALAGVARGYRCVFTLSDKQSQEKINVLRAMGAEVVVCPSNVPVEHHDSYHSVAARLAHEIPNAVHLNQYINPSNTVAHYETTGPEIWKQTQGMITHYAATVGTGGTMTGVSKYLKEQNPDLFSLGIDAYGSILKKHKETGEVDPREIYPYLSEGFGETVPLPNTDMRYIDAFVKVTDQDGTLMARRLAREEGLFVGWSSGAAVHGALEYARDHLTKGQTMVVLLPDHGTRYLNKVYHDAWMEKMGFLEPSTLKAEDILISRKGKAQPLRVVSPKATIKEALVLMAQHGVSQLPVMDKEPPVSCVTAAELTDRLIASPDDASTPVETLMAHPIPWVSYSLSIGALRAALNNPSGAVLVGDWDKSIHIITRSDLAKLIAAG